MNGIEQLPCYEQAINNTPHSGQLHSSTGSTALLDLEGGHASLGHIPSELNFEMELVGEPTLRSPRYLCGTMLAGRYLLLGHARGLDVVDISLRNNAKRKVIIEGTRFKQLRVVEECNIMLALAGRTNQIRCYNLDAILNMIEGATPNSPISENSRFTSNSNIQNGRDPITSGNEQNGNHHREFALASSSSNKRLKNKESEYFKIPETEESRLFDVKTTPAFAYLIVLSDAKTIKLFQRSDGPSLQPFVKLKSFWVPSDPVYVALAHDRLKQPQNIIAVFSEGGASLIDLRESTVKEVKVSSSVFHPPPSVSSMPRYLSQSPPKNEKRKETVGSWCSLVQTPFDISVIDPGHIEPDSSFPPPSYDSALLEAEPDLTARSPLLYLATRGRRSRIIDHRGLPFSTLVYEWSDSPRHFEFFQPSPSSAYIIAFLSSSIEIIDVNSHTSLQLVRGVPFQFLTNYHPSEEKPSGFPGVYWCCFLKDKTHLYRIKPHMSQ
ncbi:uncharacterized protein VTP21DRAFT_1681 [Calcarisporiella thermophila]|uniref:uncharacterized protein n=1 Tax=Calcarisporiella thermophila TaxID=911321 RepID=UPI0037448F1A